MTTELPFATLDVFTRTRYGGNPLAVVTIPAGTKTPSQAQKQAIAREFNLSETVFVHEGIGDEGDGDDVKTSSRKIDIFTTDAEIPFAGHPTIGTAVWLLSQGVSLDTLVTKAGPIAITQQQQLDGVVSAEIPHRVHLHERRLCDLPAALSNSQLSPHPAIRKAELDAPIFSIVKGMSFVLVELPSLELLGQVQCAGAPIVSVDQVLDAQWQEGFLCKYYFVQTGTDNNDKVEPARGALRFSIRSRMIEGLVEDPATGSAACALSSYLSLERWKHQASDLLAQYDITQGVEIGRESNIKVEVSLKNSLIDRICLAGTAISVMRGTLSI